VGKYAPKGSGGHWPAHYQLRLISGALTRVHKRLLPPGEERELLGHYGVDLGESEKRQSELSWHRAMIAVIAGAPSPASAEEMRWEVGVEEEAVQGLENVDAGSRE
jgi:hypothetical protein